jgi:hypothetical protein
MIKYNISGQGSQRSVVSIIDPSGFSNFQRGPSIIFRDKVTNEVLSIIDPSCFSIFHRGPSNSGKSVQGFSNMAVKTIFLELKLRGMGV